MTILAADCEIYVSRDEYGATFAAQDEAVFVPRAHLPAVAAALRAWAGEAIAGRRTDQTEPEHVAPGVTVSLTGGRCMDIAGADDDEAEYTDGGYDIRLGGCGNATLSPVFPPSPDYGVVRMSPDQAGRIADALTPRRPR